MALSVAVVIVKHQGKILLIERNNETYSGMLALPGGKIEEDEFAEDAAVREIKEEAGIDVEVVDYHGTVSEHLYSNGEVTDHFILNVFEAEPVDTELISSSEGDVDWHELKQVEDNVIPSDLKMIKEVASNSNFYFNCKMKDNELELFQPIKSEN